MTRLRMIRDPSPREPAGRRSCLFEEVAVELTDLVGLLDRHLEAVADHDQGQLLAVNQHHLDRHLFGVFLCSRENRAVVMNTPRAVCAPWGVPTKACRSGRLTVLSGAQHFAWMFARSRPRASWRMIPSIPASLDRRVRSVQLDYCRPAEHVRRLRSPENPQARPGGRRHLPCAGRQQRRCVWK